MSARPEHKPLGNPCIICGKEPERHRVEHIPKGDPCEMCGLPASRHKAKRERNPEYKKRHNRRRNLKSNERPVLYIGVDGEGVGRIRHKYIYMGASDETGNRTWEVENPDGLTTIQCLDFLLSLPLTARVFSYSFGYDITKIIADMPNRIIHKLMRPEIRPGQWGPKAVRWKGYKLNLQGTKLTIKKGTRSRVVWDIWKFFQGKFVEALKDWKVGSPELHERMQEMKDSRAELDKIWVDDPARVRAYCQEECMCMAQLAHKLVDAHKHVGLDLNKFYGAGSSASAMLTKMGILEKLKKAPEEMAEALACGFFGGRFENSVIGPIRETVYNYDISSAYPYQLTFLPCLLHGSWEKVTKREQIEGEGIRTALVRYTLGTSHMTSWGPFPFRSKDGSICFPTESGGGWVWRDEYISGERLFHNVQFREAWIYRCECNCQPFESIPQYYCERMRIGKEAAGIALKLGMNSCYGKLAQSIGNAIFNSWIWAGMITSGCRAQILDMMGLHQDMANVLMIATDGIYTREKIVAPIPRDTGTATILYADGTPVVDDPKKVCPKCESAVTNNGNQQSCTKCEWTGLRKPIHKPLGGWEEKRIDKGVFVARPGIYFPMRPTKKEIKSVRARGVGKGVVLENWEMIVNSFEKHGVKTKVFIKEVSRFCGAKSSISKSGIPGYEIWNRANARDKEHTCKTDSKDRCLACTGPSYGEWVARPVDMSFNPWPKRLDINPDGLTLTIRRMPFDLESIPYKKALIPNEVREMKKEMEMITEQPDIDLADYEFEELANWS